HNNDADMIESTEDFNHILNFGEAPEAPSLWALSSYFGADQNLGLSAAHATAVLANSARLNSKSTISCFENSVFTTITTAAQMHAPMPASAVLHDESRCSYHSA